VAVYELCGQAENARGVVALLLGSEHRRLVDHAAYSIMPGHSV
jgi:hypothetical protein